MYHIQDNTCNTWHTRSTGTITIHDIHEVHTDVHETPERQPQVDPVLPGAPSASHPALPPDSIGQHPMRALFLAWLAAAATFRDTFPDY